MLKGANINPDQSSKCVKDLADPDGVGRSFLLHLCFLMLYTSKKYEILIPLDRKVILVMKPNQTFTLIPEH